jgi:iron(III) transport system substrate-binding protein
MRLSRILFGLVLIVLVGVPVALAPRGRASASDAERLVIFTPHNEQIRQEFGDAFRRWHAERYGAPAEIAWMQPGGTSEIRKMLESAYVADLKALDPSRVPADGMVETGVGGNADLFFGGGSYEYTQLSNPISVTVDGAKRSTTILEPLPLPPATLKAVYGTTPDAPPPLIGDAPLYDKGFRWYGAALSGFGIVWNPQVLRELGVPEPSHWADLCDPRLYGWIVLVNPAQSGSVTTAFEAILQRRGWTDGWRILRRMAANARSFAASAPKAPTDVSLGDAAAGVCIDFYGRFQAQAMLDAAGDGGAAVPRVGYVDPAGETVIDPDPVAMLRGAPNRALAERFVEFVLSTEGQALWQLHAKSRLPNPPADGLGPETYELRRMPVRRDLYATLGDRFVDKVDPWQIATAVENPNRSFRAFLPTIFVAFSIDNRQLLRDAWQAIVTHPAYAAAATSSGRTVVTADDVADPDLRRMLELFDALPTVRGPAGATFDLGDPATLEKVRAGWLKGDWAKDGLWPADALPAEVLRAEMTAFFRRQYEEILAIAARGGGRS